MMQPGMQRRIWKTEKAGSIRRLRLVEDSLPPLKSDHVRVRVRAVGLNFADLFALTGLYSATPDGPFIPGLEFSGEVSEVGRSVAGSTLTPGQRVMGCIRFGGYAEIVDVPASQLQTIPQSVDFRAGRGFFGTDTDRLVRPFHAGSGGSRAAGVDPQRRGRCRSAGDGDLPHPGRRTGGQRERSTQERVLGRTWLRAGDRPRP